MWEKRGRMRWKGADAHEPNNSHNFDDCEQKFGLAIATDTDQIDHNDDHKKDGHKD